MKQIQNKFSRGFTPVILIIGLLIVISVVLVGLNQFSTKHLASPTCSTQSEIDAINQNKSSLETQIADIDAQITENNNTIVSLQTSLVEKNTQINQIVIVSDYEMTSLKSVVDSRNKAYLTAKANASKRGLSASAKAVLDKVTASYKLTYDNTLSQYNQKLATNNTNKAKLQTLNSEKAQINLAVTNADNKYVELNTSRTNLQSQIDATTASIGDANTNICPTSESSCGNGMDDDKDGTVDCGDGDCSTSSECQVKTCSRTEQDSNGDCVADSYWWGSACTDGNDNDNDVSTDCLDSDCASDTACGGSGTLIIDTTTNTGTSGCNTNSDCSSGQACSAGICIADTTGTGTGYCTSDAECSSNQSCNGGSCTAKSGDGNINGCPNPINCRDWRCIDELMCNNIYPLCGNGKNDVDTIEECDDGNRTAGDGCGPDCKIEKCHGTPPFTFNDEFHTYGICEDYVNGGNMAWKLININDTFGGGCQNNRIDYSCTYMVLP